MLFFYPTVCGLGTTSVNIAEQQFMSFVLVTCTVTLQEHSISHLLMVLI